MVLLRLLLRILFGFRAHNLAPLRTPGPVLLLPNHVSWLDWLFLGAVLDPDWKFVTSKATANTSCLHRWIMTGRRTIPIDPHSPYAVRTMEEHLEKGGRLVLFAEGQISATGSLMKLYDGTGFLIRKADAKVILCYLRGANRIWFVKHRGWRKFFPRVSAHFSDVQRPPAFGGIPHAEERHKLTDWVRDRMVQQQFDVEMEFGPSNALAAVAAVAGQIPGRTAVEDSTGSILSYRRLMTAAEVLAGAWLRLEVRGERVGVVLPNVAGLPVTLLSLWGAGAVPALLNYTSGVPALLRCAGVAGIRRVVTSRRFLEKAGIDPRPIVAGGRSSRCPSRSQVVGIAPQRCVARRPFEEGSAETAGYRGDPLHQRIRGDSQGSRAHPPQPSGKRPAGDGFRGPHR